MIGSPDFVWVDIEVMGGMLDRKCSGNSITEPLYVGRMAGVKHRFRG